MVLLRFPKIDTIWAKFLNISIKNVTNIKKKEEKYERTNNDTDTNEIILIRGTWLYIYIFLN